MKVRAVRYLLRTSTHWMGLGTQHPTCDSNSWKGLLMRTPGPTYRRAHGPTGFDCSSTNLAPTVLPPVPPKLRFGTTGCQVRVGVFFGFASLKNHATRVLEQRILGGPSSFAPNNTPIILSYYRIVPGMPYAVR